MDNAVAAAEKAFQRNSLWRKMDASRRGNLLVKAAELLEQNLNYIAVSENKLIKLAVVITNC